MSPTNPAIVPAAPELPPIAESPAMRELLRSLHEVAPTPTTVLLLGPRGSGRGRLARFLHLCSGRAGPCVEVRCGGPADLIAASIRPAFWAAAGGTVLLREVGALPEPAQVALVRALQDRDPAAPDEPRVVATAEPSLGPRAVEGLFRSELFYRLNVFPLSVPGLKERALDLAGLARSILSEKAAGEPPRTICEEELADIGTRAHTVADLVGLLCLAPLPEAEARPSSQEEKAVRPAFPGELPLDLEQLERLAIGEALRRAGGNRTQAARLLHIGLRTLRNKLRSWREAGEEVPPSPHAARQDLPALRGPGATETAAILARSWARRSQEGQA